MLWVLCIAVSNILSYFVSFTFLVQCCDIRFDNCIKSMYRLSCPPVVCRRAHVLFELCILMSYTTCLYELHGGCLILLEHLYSPHFFLVWPMLVIFLVFIVVFWFFVCLSSSRVSNVTSVSVFSNVYFNGYLI